MTRLLSAVLHIAAILGSNFVTGTPTLSLEVDSDRALFAIRNSSSGIVISITPLCSSGVCSSQSLLVEDVFLPDECSVVPCNDHQLLITTSLSHGGSTTQYVLGVPSVQSLLLLRFYYDPWSRFFELKERMIVDEGITNCNPTAILLVDEAYYSLCVNRSESKFIIYEIENLDDFQKVSFSQVMDSFETLTLPVTDISVVNRDADHFILFVGGSELISIDTDQFNFDRYCFDACTGDIYKISPRNTSEIDPAIPYLLYCDLGYGVIDILEMDDPVPYYYYNETGYPVICRNGNNVVSEITIFVDGKNNTLKLDAKNFSIPGRQILPEESSCFDFDDDLLFVYSDRVLGSVMVSLRDDNLRVLFSEMCEWSPCAFEVVDNRYVLLTEQYNDTNVRLRLYDALEDNFVSDNTLNFTTSLTQLIVLPRSPSNTLVLGSSIGGALLLLLIFVSAVIGIIRYVYKFRRRVRDAQEELFIQRGVQVQEHDNFHPIPVYSTPQSEQPESEPLLHGQQQPVQNGQQPDRQLPVPFTDDYPAQPNNNSFSVPGNYEPPIGATHYP